MKEFMKFMLGYYWNDTDSMAVGYRFSVIGCWAILVVGLFIPIIGALEIFFKCNQ